MVTQWLCGEAVEVVGGDAAWARCRGEDGYEGWIPASGLLLESRAAAGADPTDDEWLDRWTREAAWSLGTPISWPLGGTGYLPWGARVRARADRLGLPDGRQVLPEDRDAIVDASGLERRFPRDPEALVRTARRWLGTPYLWGGRTNTGADCSGFVQSVFRVHGVRLPRDSRDQGAEGHVADDVEHILGESKPGDLVFFAPEGKGISHVAVSTGGGGIIHCSAGRGEVTEEDLSPRSSLDALQRLLRGSAVCATRPLEAGDEGSTR
ncbi:MAG: C40 family peptidase [Gemmatimonadota bacterium]|nr:MAG: C40 family peptidase [Gemmatimonadota bacterium]